MRELKFEVTFKSAVILQASSNTQGKVDVLDFIPGSNFLGMAAAKYSKFSAPFEIFHSSKVRFGDASPFVNGKDFFKIPLSYFQDKFDVNLVGNHHFLIENDYKDFTQPKQIRQGYMSLDGEKFDLDYEYSQKSAYDKELGRSKDSQMYGYEALKAGNVWRFVVRLDDSISKDDENLLIKTLENSTKLGKSKTSQYGEISIRMIADSSENLPKFTPQNDLTYIYANSRISLVDKGGNPTFDLKFILPNLSDENVCYEKTQIRTSSFTPFNAVRNTKDYERICINKGSVIVLKGLSLEQILALEKGVGAYLSEGFGDVIVNPKFLQHKKIEFISKGQNYGKKAVKTQPTTRLVKILKAKKDEKIKMFEIANDVDEFIVANGKKLKNMNSQWGTIRSMCRAYKNEDPQNFKAKLQEFITQGVAKEKWKDGKAEILLKAIENAEDKVKFAQLLAMRMPRIGDKNA